MRSYEQRVCHLKLGLAYKEFQWLIFFLWLVIKPNAVLTTPKSNHVEESSPVAPHSLEPIMCNLVVPWLLVCLGIQTSFICQ